VERSIVELPAFYRPVEVARLLRCSEWWVREQARRRRVPFIRVGGRYLFTAEHVAELVRRFEVRPIDESPAPAGPVVRPVVSPDNATQVRLTARVPRRMRSAACEAA
jgi:excisionase family DNA binding protein